MNISRLVPLGAVLLVTSCQQGLSGRWILVRVDGDSVPASVAHFPGDTLKIYGGFLEFRGGDTVIRAERTEGWRQVDSGTTRLWHYQMRRDSIAMNFDCGPMMRCPGEEPGVVTRDSLVLRSPRYGDVRLVYRPGSRPDR